MLYRNAGHQSHYEDRQRHGRHPNEEFAEFPARDVRDQEILRLADQRGDAAERGTYRRMHYEAAQVRAKPNEIFPVKLVNSVIDG